DVMILLCGSDPARLAAPGHDRGIRREPPLEDLVPADDAAPSRIEEFLDTLDEVALQLVFVRQPLPTNHFLRQRALLPPFLRRLISADVNVLAREDGHHLGE